MVQTSSDSALKPDHASRGRQDTRKHDTHWRRTHHGANLPSLQHHRKRHKETRHERKTHHDQKYIYMKKQKTHEAALTQQRTATRTQENDLERRHSATRYLLLSWWMASAGLICRSGSRKMTVRRGMRGSPLARGKHVAEGDSALAILHSSTFDAPFTV